MLRINVQSLIQLETTTTIIRRKMPDNNSNNQTKKNKEKKNKQTPHHNNKKKSKYCKKTTKKKWRRRRKRNLLLLLEAEPQSHKLDRFSFLSLFLFSSLFLSGFRMFFFFCHFSSPFIYTYTSFFLSFPPSLLLIWFDCFPLVSGKGRIQDYFDILD